MTKEECIALLKRFAEYNGMGIPNLAGCREAMRTAAELLSRPSLSSNLGEAAEEWCKRNNKGIALCADKKSHYLVDGIDAFKACAEWIHGQPDAKLDSSLVNEWASHFSPEIRDSIKSTAYHFWNIAISLRK